MAGLSTEEMWMREPEKQCGEAILYYKEIIDYILDDLNQLKYNGIITEGAAYLPEIMKKLNIPKNRYISITPSETFQIYHYKQRDWINLFLEGCSDKEKAFSNWMNRDILFAKEMQKQCKEFMYTSIVNDGIMTVEKMVSFISKHFGLE